MQPEDLRDQLHLLESGISQIKKGQGEQAEYLGTIMRHLVEIRSDATYARTLGEYLAPKLAPLLKDPGLIVELEDLKRTNDKARNELRAASVPARPPQPSFSSLTDTGKHEAITESQLKLAMALDRNQELEQERKESRESRQYWGRWAMGLAALLVVGTVTGVLVSRLTRPANSMTVETKELQR